MGLYEHYYSTAATTFFQCARYGLYGTANTDVPALSLLCF